jgi:hypothetical protein
MFSRITTTNPTLEEVAVAIRDGSSAKHVTARDVARFARKRGVPVKDGRVPRERQADLFFEAVSLL